MKRQFDGTRETGDAPRHFNGEHVYNQVDQGSPRRPWEEWKESPRCPWEEWEAKVQGKKKMSRRKGRKRSKFFGSYLTGNT